MIKTKNIENSEMIDKIVLIKIKLFDLLNEIQILSENNNVRDNIRITTEKYFSKIGFSLDEFILNKQR